MFFVYADITFRAIRAILVSPTGSNFAQVPAEESHDGCRGTHYDHGVHDGEAFVSHRGHAQVVPLHANLQQLVYHKVGVTESHRRTAQESLQTRRDSILFTEQH